jgi:tetratricopeptide (TPR) repeat protein
MGSKEGMVIAPIIVLLYDRIFLADSWAELWKQRSALYAGLAATWLILISLVIVNQAGPGRGLIGSPGVSSWRYAKNQFGAIAHYLRLTFWPDSLCIDYGWQVSPLPRSWKAVGAVLVVCLAAATGWALLYAAPVGFLGAWFFLTLAPTSSVVPIQDMVAERRMYLPLAAVVTLTVIAGWNSLSTLSRRIKLNPAMLGWAFFALIAGALAWRTAQRNHDYHNGIAIWTETTRQRPQNGRAWNNLGSSYAQAGRFDSAVACFQRAIELLPTYSLARGDAYANLGNVRFAQGRYSEAITLLSEALHINPYSAEAHTDLANALRQVGHREEAMGHFRTAIRLEADYGLAHYGMGLLFTDVGDFDEALRELQAARPLLPDRPEIPFKIGVLLINRGRYTEACANFTEALQLKPDFEEALQYLRFCEEKRRKPEAR